MPTTTRVYFINGAPWLDDLKLFLNCVSDNPDVILGMSITQMGSIQEAVARWPKAKLVIYHWDCYSWIWDRPRDGEYNYRVYGELLKRCAEVWVPSQVEADRTKQWWGIEAVVVPTFVPLFDAVVGDEGYVLNPLRELPDAHHGWFEQACEEVGVPYVCSKHGNEYEEHKKLIANCRFLCSPYKETSTGGLDLMKGYHLGKPSLIWHESGARDYFGEDAVYFYDYEDLKKKLRQLYDHPPRFTTQRTFSLEAMRGIMQARLGGLHENAR